MTEGLSDSEIKDAFSCFDKSNKGAIKTQDLARALGRLGLNPTDSEMASIINKVDPEGKTKKCSFQNFMGIVKAENKGYTSVKGIVEAFQVFDREGDGVIETDELKHVLLCLGEKLPVQEVDDLLAEADPNNSGRIEYEGFARMLMD